MALRTSHRKPNGSQRGELCKLRLNLEPDSWHGYGSETLWVQRIGEGRFRIRNSPFFAFGISAEDIVFGEKGSDGILSEKGISLRGGHSTYRVILREGISEANVQKCWEPLELLGCTYEEGPLKLRSIDVPQNLDVYKVYELLEKGEKNNIWYFEEGHCGHPLKSKAT
ncbi:MAG: DUF4265 domain-containing protein [Nitrospirales bacterium]|nr:DUF4265 domain-containing protein [Nitrospirales bacterium]